jgi:hypothetical protein
MPNSIIKLWLSNDMKKINGANKFQPDELANVTIVHNWSEICELL